MNQHLDKLLSLITKMILKSQKKSKMCIHLMLEVIQKPVIKLGLILMIILLLIIFLKDKLKLSLRKIRTIFVKNKDISTLIVLLNNDSIPS